MAVSAGGPSYAVAKLCRHLGPLGFNVSILTVDLTSLRDDMTLMNIPVEEGVSMKAVSCIGSVDRRLVFSPPFPLAVANALHRHRPRILHNHGIWMLENHFALRAANRAGVPVVCSVQGMVSPWAIRHHSFKKKMVWRLYQERDLKRVAVFHATSEEEADAIRRVGFRQPIAVVPNGVDIPRVLPVSSKKGRKRIVLFLSRVHPSKGVEMLIDAWTRIDTRGWECRIVGPVFDAYKAKLQQKIDTLGLENDVRLFDMVDHDAKWSVYREADLFVLPSHSESFGIVVAEALAAGVPVVTTKGAPWRALLDQQCGWWVDVELSAISNAMHEAMHLSAAKRRRMGERGRAFVAENFAWTFVAAEMAAVYRWVCGEGGRPSCIHVS